MEEERKRSELMTSEPLDINIRIPTPNESIQKIADTFEKRVGKGLEKSISRLGLADFKPVASGAGAAASGAGGDAAAGSKAAIAGGVAGGLVAGGVVGLLAVIADALKDMPIITAIMKMFKLILMILLMPLIPVLKPVLLALAWLAKQLAKIFVPNTEEKNDAAGIGGIVGALLGSVLGPLGAVLGAALGAAIGALIAGPMNALMKWLVDVLYAFGALIVSAGTQFFIAVGKFIYDLGGLIVKTITWVWSEVQNFGQLIWDKIIMPAFSFLQNAGAWIWNMFIQPAFNFLNNCGEWIWMQIIQPAFDFLKNVGTWIWDNILKKPFDFVAEKLNDVVTAIKNVVNSIKNSISNAWNSLFGGSSMGDGVVSNGRIITTDPNDFIIATKNPGALGVGSSGGVTINIDRPSVRNDADIKELVKQISMELYRNQRRSNSYA